jgi:hypothetical protein
MYTSNAAPKHTINLGARVSMLLRTGPTTFGARVFGEVVAQKVFRTQWNRKACYDVRWDDGTVTKGLTRGELRTEG